MRELSARFFSAKLRKLTVELRSLDRGLKSNPSLNGATLREFRQALDNIRLTAWTVNELLNARQSQKNPEAVMSFLTAERLRRLRQMVNDLCSDLEHGGLSWPVHEVHTIQESLTLLQERLAIAGENKKAGKGA